ncbi:hypothetical protein SCFA_2870006 [anaerobic digester metagenome]|jgi:hypothetical protein|uniref:Uncharacterized protein n=1 Tax=anaerobic digester metagenome TaxID=1263854 RepID=A0A485M0H5_9ZZZZ
MAVYSYFLSKCEFVRTNLLKELFKSDIRGTGMVAGEFKNESTS